MPTYSVSFYDVDPRTIFSQTVGNTSSYTGPATTAGTATITDNGPGTDSLTLEDRLNGETATADTVLNGVPGGTSDVFANHAWTLRDTVTGETFQVVTFAIRSGTNRGQYTLSERQLIVGRTYETVAYDTNPDATTGDPVFTYADYVPESDGIVEGTAGNDVIDASYTGDPQLDRVDYNDAPGGTPSPAQFNWTDYLDEQDLRGGVTQDTGDVSVTVTYSDVQTTEEFSAELSGGTANSIYVAPGEPFNATSAAYLFANGSPDNTTLTFDFAANTPTAFENSVQNVQFRISDIDGLNDGTNNFQDIVTVYAYDELGNAVPVNITGGSNHTVVGNTITAGLSNGGPGDASGSALIEIPGPVSQIVVVYDNGGTTQQAIYFSDIHFDAVPQGSNDDEIHAGDGDDLVLAGYGDDSVRGGAGADTIYGEAGADTLEGGAGNDVLYVGSGDQATGGDGDDTFIIDPNALNGGTLKIAGGEGAETAGDTLDFNGQLQPGTINYTNTNDKLGGLSGTATLLDGTVVSFSEIENVICFASSTLIETPYGPRPVESLKVGDLILTRDHGPKPLRWIGHRKVQALTPRVAPIEFAPGAIGNTRRLLVSPQHRVLIEDYRASLYLGDDEVLVVARHMVNGTTIRRMMMPEVVYHHLMFDQHEIVLSDGVWTESYMPGSYSVKGLAPEMRASLFDAFPGLRSSLAGYGHSARMTADVHAARMLAA